jgi:hypothetical protein
MERQVQVRLWEHRIRNSKPHSLVMSLPTRRRAEHAQRPDWVILPSLACVTLADQAAHTDDPYRWRRDGRCRSPVARGRLWRRVRLCGCCRVPRDVHADDRCGTQAQDQLTKKPHRVDLGQRPSWLEHFKVVALRSVVSWKCNKMRVLKCKSVDEQYLDLMKLREEVQKAVAKSSRAPSLSEPRRPRPRLSLRAAVKCQPVAV